MAVAEALGIAVVRPGLQHGVADEADGHAVAGEELFLERQQAEQAVPQPRKAAHSALAPGPNLGRHVMHAFQAQTFDALQQAQREPGAVYGHYQIRGVRCDVRHRLVKPAPEGQHAGQDFSQPHHGQVGHGEQGSGQAGGQHAGAADAAELQIGTAGAECRDQSGAQYVAAGLAGQQPDHRAISP